MISSIILSAGASGRMGTPKALLKIGGKTFLQQIIATLQHEKIDTKIAVLGAHAEHIKTSIEDIDVTIVINQQWQQGQLSSLVKGLEVLNYDTTDGVLVWPVDHPLVSKKVIGEMIDKFTKQKGFIIIPMYKGRRGHPVIFPKILFNELTNAPLGEGARAVVRQHHDKVYELETDDESVLVNIDTPDDYEKYIV